jgi:hypothetical protein
MKLSLDKAAETLSLVMDKSGVKEITPCQVLLAFDTSYSFINEHKCGYTQLLLERFVPFAMIFDKDKTIDSYTFSDTTHKEEDINLGNYSTYVKDVIINSPTFSGGTDYLPTFRSMFSDISTDKTIPITQTIEKKPGFFGRLFGAQTETTEVVVGQEVVKADSNERHLIFFVTDGDCNNLRSSKPYLKNNIPDNAFILFISISNGYSFSYFANDDLNGKNYDHINMTPQELRNLIDTPDEDLYKLIVTDNMVNWMNK